MGALSSLLRLNLKSVMDWEKLFFLNLELNAEIGLGFIFIF